MNNSSKIDIKVNLTPKQQSFVSSDCRLVVYSGGVGAGKTQAGCIKSIIHACKYPSTMGMIGARTYPMLRDSTMIKFFELCPHQIIKSWLKNEKILTLVNGSIIVFRSFDQEHKLRGPTLNFVYIDEATEVHENIYKQLIGRLRQTENACMFITTNPGSLSNWVYRFAIEKKDTKDVHVVFTNTLENPYLPKNYIEDLKNTYTGDFYNRFILGEWGSVEGIIYSMFNRSVHIITQLPVDHTRLSLYLGVDWGMTNPTAVVFVLRDDNGMFYVAREYYKREATADVHAHAIKRIIEELGFKLKDVQSIHVDPSAKGFMEELRQHGLLCVKANNDVWAGIIKVQSLLASGKLFVHHSCKELIREFQSYMVNENAQVREAPLKQDDHGLDALRYMIYSSTKGSIRGF